MLAPQAGYRSPQRSFFADRGAGSVQELDGRDRSLLNDTGRLLAPKTRRRRPQLSLRSSHFILAVDAGAQAAQPRPSPGTDPRRAAATRL